MRALVLGDDFLELCRHRRRKRKKARKIDRKIMKTPLIAMPIIAPVGSAEGFGCEEGIGFEESVGCEESADCEDIVGGAEASSFVVALIELESVEVVVVVVKEAIFDVLDSMMLDFDAILSETIDDFELGDGDGVGVGVIEAVVCLGGGEVGITNGTGSTRASFGGPAPTTGSLAHLRIMLKKLCSLVDCERFLAVKLLEKLVIRVDSDAC